MASLQSLGVVMALPPAEFRRSECGAGSEPRRDETPSVHPSVQRCGLAGRSRGDLRSADRAELALLAPRLRRRAVSRSRSG
eukprot:scaffold33700_cov31-Phaeocystis_antarctica.AAC.1